MAVDRAGFKCAYERYWLDRQSGRGGCRDFTGTIHNEILESVRVIVGSGPRLLDVGCGDGGVTEIALSRYKQAHGCDLSERALREAVTKGMKSVCADLNSGALPYKNESFDCVTCLEVIEHVVDPLALLLELRRVLRSRGLLIITTPNIRYFRNIVKLLVNGRFPHTTTDTFVWGGGHLHYFTRKDLASLLNAAGFVRCEFVLNEEQFVRSWKRRVLARIMGKAQFGEWVCGGITASAVRG